MKKIIDVIMYIIIPSVVGYTTFFLLYTLYKKLFYEYRLLAVIPFAIVTTFFIKINIKEWRLIKQQE